jgi:CheY-like chemotaxis protein
MEPIKVMLVDDFADALEAWSYFLTARGFSVITSDNGLEAVEKATAELPDIVVLDLDLPGRTGIEVARMLREQPRTHRIPLVAMTGQSHGVDMERARASGFDTVLIKPQEPEAFAAELRRLCGAT